MVLLTIGSFIDTLGDQVIIALVSCVICFVTGYIFVREKILKNELKTDQMTSYIDGHVKLLENKVLELQSDITDFKEINRDTARSLTENTVAIRELKSVMSMIKEQLNYSSNRNRRRLEDNDDI